ncbi:M15 family metallopeptidase [Bradyrhizobium liaoningense]|uniref:M15 family metallopeptidase n=1 Tax=Bradyrhizobium liaoningense TaxID=43992 RepID=UPI001BAB29EE|nr:M15 family metallopeptidase [Bradyrhizobium liaoningense]MBR0907000.1 M15 family metallopeptidase [Bradyrhizobium liaoningense]
MASPGFRLPETQLEVYHLLHCNTFFSGMEADMSAPLFRDDVLFYQRVLSVSGFYGGALDGRWTAAVEAADEAFAAEFSSIATELGAFDSRSEGNIRTLVPQTQRAARGFLARAKQLTGFDVKIISGTRTYAEQELLYRKGRGSPGPIVTNAKGGQSNHNFAIAWDVGIFKNGRYLTGDTASEAKTYKKLAELARDGDLEWGGDWTSFRDMPHYQLRLGLTLGQVKGLFESGKPYTDHNLEAFELAAPPRPVRATKAKKAKTKKAKAKKAKKTKAKKTKSKKTKVRKAKAKKTRRAAPKRRAKRG